MLGFCYAEILQVFHRTHPGVLLEQVREIASVDAYVLNVGDVVVYVGISRWSLQLVFLCICDDRQSEVEHAHEPEVICVIRGVVSKHIKYVLFQFVAILAGEYRLVLCQTNTAHRVLGTSARESEPDIPPWMVFV